MKDLINYYQSKKFDNNISYILLYDKKKIIRVKNNPFSQDQVNTINENIKLAIKQNQEFLEINLS